MHQLLFVLCFSSLMQDVKKKKTTPKTIRNRKCRSCVGAATEKAEHISLRGFLPVYGSGWMETVTLSLVLCALMSSDRFVRENPWQQQEWRQRRWGGGLTASLRKEKETPSKLSAFVAPSAFTSRAVPNQILWRFVAGLASPVCLLVYFFIYLSIFPINLLATAVVDWRRLPGLSSGNVVVSFSFSLSIGLVAAQRVDWVFLNTPPPPTPTHIVHVLHVHFSFLCSDPQPPLNVHATQNSLCPYFRTVCVSNASVILPGKRKLISSLQQDSSSCHQSVSPSVHFSFFITSTPSFLHTHPRTPHPLYAPSPPFVQLSLLLEIFSSRADFFFFTSSPRYSHVVLASAT